MQGLLMIKENTLGLLQIWAEMLWMMQMIGLLQSTWKAQIGAETF